MRCTKRTVGRLSKWRALCLAACAPLAVRAAPVDTVQHAPREWAVEVGPQVQYQRYREPGLMQEDGVLYGLFGAYSEAAGGVIWEVFGSFMWGDLRYDGGTFNIATGEFTPSQVDTPNRIFNARATATWSALNPSLAPYMGIGYRRLIDELPGDSGYTREQSYVYVPVGVQAVVLRSAAWRVDARIELDVLLAGANRSHAESNDFDVRVSQDSGYGLNGRFRIERLFHASGGSGIDRVLVEPFITYWDIGESDSEFFIAEVEENGRSQLILLEFYEPANTTVAYGIRAGLVF